MFLSYFVMTTNDIRIYSKFILIILIRFSIHSEFDKNIYVKKDDEDKQI